MKKQISDEKIIKTAATLSNKVGLNNLSLKMIAKELNIKSPSLYNHFSSLEDIRKKLMIYGWKNVEEKMINSTANVSGYQALKNMCYEFYDFTINNKGVFSAMLWYNMYDDNENFEATKKLHETIYKEVKSLNISEYNTKHAIRLMRSFLEGFALLVNNNAFGDSLSIKDSFDISIEILMNSIKTLEGK